MSAPEWPKHADGSPKRMGEMTHDEQRAQWKAAAARLEREFKRAAPAIAKVLRDFDESQDGKA